MAWDRAVDDAFNRLLGHSEEELHRFHKGAERSDLSTKPWIKRKWADLSRGIAPFDSGFDSHERWKSYVFPQSIRRILPASAPLQHPSVRKKRRGFVSDGKLSSDTSHLLFGLTRTKQSNAIKDS